MSNDIFESAGVGVEDIKDEVDRGSIKRPTLISSQFSDHCVEIGVIPEIYKDRQFNVPDIHELVSKNVNTFMKSAKMTKLVDFNEYVELLSFIISSLRFGKNITRSYLIGAEEGLGQIEFVVEVTRIAVSNGWKVVPAISLEEIAIRRYQDEKLLKAFDSGKKERALLETEWASRIQIGESNERKRNTHEYKYLDFLEADIIVTYLSGVSSYCRDVETDQLRQLVFSRAMKGKPTIVLTYSPLRLYTSDTSDATSKAWYSMITEDAETRVMMDKLLHKSTFWSKLDGRNLKTIGGN